MNKTAKWLAVMACMVCMPQVFAESMTLEADATLVSVLQAHKGKSVTLQLDSGQELTGIVKGMSGDLVQLTELSGKEYFDALIELGDISAVVVRAK